MPKFSKPLILLALAAAIGAALGVGAQPAQARSMSSCSTALIHDWYVDGRVDKTYPVHCYREALKQIPEDQIIYGTLREDLNRALQCDDPPARWTRDGDTLVVPLAGPSDGGGNSGTAAQGWQGVFHWVAQELGPSTADSIPIPLLVLGGLAFALMAAAGVSLRGPPGAGPRAAADPPPVGPSFESAEIPLQKGPHGYHEGYVRGCFYGPDPDRRRLLEDAPPHRSRLDIRRTSSREDSNGDRQGNRDSGTGNPCG